METEVLYQSIRPRYPEFQGQVAVVTGSGRGIGKSIAIRLAREGMNVVISSDNQLEMDQTTAELRQCGATVISEPADMGRAEDIDTLFRTTFETFGRLDLLVNNAADTRREHFFDVDLPFLDHQLAVNIRGPYLCAAQAARLMRQSRQGNIINISSVGALRAHWRGLPYDMTKGAIDAMTRAMSLDLAREGIRVNAVAPGPTWLTAPLDDPEVEAIQMRVPLGRIGLALEVGAAVAFLASDEASYITGQVLCVDGGVTAQLSPFDQPI